MGHKCCSKQKVKRGLWSPEEDEKLLNYITTHGHGSWSTVPKLAGLQRCGKSCRLRWINYLRPDLRRGTFSAEEEQIIIDIHRILGNRWAQIAKHLPGRTDNEVKNFWNSCIKKKLISQGLDPKTHNMIPSHERAGNKVTRSGATHSHQQTFSITNVNSKPAMEIKQPILPLPSTSPLNNAQPSLLQTVSVPTSTSGYENPKALMSSLQGHNSHDPISLFCASPIENTLISSSSSSSLNPYALSTFEGNCLWGSNAMPLEVPSLGELQSQEQEMNPSNTRMKTFNEAKGVEDMDVSFDSSSFDLDSVVSTFLSGSIRHDLTYVEDFAWNF
ncbi:hypothetical protein K2173_001305 [Erythroxylum novogranatense]|uniref:Uncharacterized protein n=1 Tax=Erythroxylum novogranatense TaxID=1862640 RepID=A0AAV8T560_9ROSI|nr:hypothetical protein K2173_001305 [Erythroxylum novogranatense]